MKDVNAGTIAWTFPTSANNLPVISPGTQFALQLWAETDVIPGSFWYRRIAFGNGPKSKRPDVL